MLTPRGARRLAAAKLDWITALRGPRSRNWPGQGPAASLFDVQDLAEITSPDFPGERLIACMNPFLEAERAANANHCSRPPKPTWPRSPPPARGPPAAARPGQDRRARGQSAEPAQGRQALHHRHRRGPLQLPPQPGLDHRRSRPGRHLRARTSVTATDLEPGEVVSSYKALAQVERAFRAFNTDLDIGPSGTTPRTGPRARILADAVVLHHLAHARPPRARPVHRRRQARRLRRPAQPGRPRRPLPRALAKAATKQTPATSRCTASPPCSPTSAPSA